MMDMYEYFEECRENGISPEDALQSWLRDEAEYRAQRFAELEEESLVNAWQHDLIDMRRMER